MSGGILVDYRWDSAVILLPTKARQPDADFHHLIARHHRQHGGWHRNARLGYCAHAGSGNQSRPFEPNGAPSGAQDQGFNVDAVGGGDGRAIVDDVRVRRPCESVQR